MQVSLLTKIGILVLSWNLLICQSDTFEVHPEIISTKLVKTSKVLSGLDHDSFLEHPRVKAEKLGTHLKKDWFLHPKVNEKSFPQGMDKAVQKVYNTSRVQKSMQSTFEGINYTGVNPSDPSIDVGPNHIVLMVNGASGSKFQIYNRAGQVLKSEMYFDELTGISGKGDPIVLYDQFADRWLLSEFAKDANQLVVAISSSADPLGSYHIYTFDTPYFPDYPKYAIWNDSYIITTNENTQAAYALERQKMLTGDQSTSALRFTMPDFPTIGFQTATPVDMTGENSADLETPGMLMRMADDGWSTTIQADRLEMYEVNIDWNNPSTSQLSGPIHINTIPFDTELCGYSSYSCIQQPNSSIKLDPLREVIMNKISYRRFDSHESIVLCHVTDVSNSDHAGIRWYELRRTSDDWFIHQQGTYAPDSDQRWMPMISINDEGSIALAYNISSNSTYPSLRITGRQVCDPLGMMTQPEITFAQGTKANASNRYGDYNTMVVDPLDGSFWMAGQYNPGSQWSTKIGNYEIESSCEGIELSTDETDISLCSQGSLQVEVHLSTTGPDFENIDLSIENVPGGVEGILSTNSMSSEGTFYLTLNSNSTLPSGPTNFQVIASNSNHYEVLDINLTVIMSSLDPVSLVSPADFAENQDTNPTLSWHAQGETSSYDIQLSTSAEFESDVYNFMNISGNMISIDSPLNEGEIYYWKVRSTNECGTGDYSPVFQFSTVSNSCELYVYQGPTIPINASSPSIVELPISVNNSGTLSALSVNNVKVSHTWIGDISIELISPSGTSAELVYRKCSSANGMDLNFAVDGNAYNTLPCPPMSADFFMPKESLLIFDGEEVNGTWLLRVQDHAAQDGGTAESWALEICTSNDTGSQACDITASISNINCLNHNTTSPTDDTFVFSLSASGTGISEFYNLSGAFALNNVSYDETHFFNNGGNGFLISSGNLDLTITDSADGECWTSLTIESPEHCSSELPCSSEIMISDRPITEMEYEASISLISDGVVAANSNVEFRAAQWIELQSGFEVEPNGTLVMSIEDCSSNIQSLNESHSDE